MALVVHAYNLSYLGGWSRRIHEFKTCLNCRVRSRLALDNLESFSLKIKS